MTPAYRAKLPAYSRWVAVCACGRRRSCEEIPWALTRIWGMPHVRNKPRKRRLINRKGDSNHAP